MDSPVRIATLSHAHGHIGSYCRQMVDFEDVELVAAWDDNAERGKKAAADFGMEYRPEVDAILSDDTIDAVMIGSETNRHAGFTVRAAEAGKHILLQKPMATTLADCDRIIEAVNHTGVKFSMAFQMRQDPVNRRIKKIVGDGILGRIAVVRRRHSIPVLLNEGFTSGPTKWHFDPEANIGMFFDDANHAADWFYWTFGAPVTVTAEIDRIVTDFDSDDNGVALYRFADGMLGTLFNSSTTLHGVNVTEIYGTEGTLIQDYGDSPSTSAPRPADAVPLKYIRKGDTEWTVPDDLTIPASQGERIAAVARPFVDYLLGKTDERVSAEEGRVSVAMVLGAYESARDGRRVTLPAPSGHPSL